ncbi:unnamed protein product [Rotaria magnacalcarata]|uniref:Glycoside hydrolase family 31 TIM barrel domain-containing protein n=1 Tax=Rotaria magnacalcarata TaxID=392030 RepID=A0A8S2QQS6_9BILA|nr:unnamed protein product [Rotaria magnacalcarata]
MQRLFILFWFFGQSLSSVPYAEWAHYHMVWLHNSHTNQADIQAMVNSYLENRISVGIVNIDFRWETNVNTFMFNPTGFLSAKEELDEFRQKEVLDPEVTWLKSRTAYYNDSFQILRQLVGEEALIMSRPVDYDLDFSPHDIVFIGWVGDQRGTYDGPRKALRYMLESGRRHYVGFGSDIGGYDTDPNAGPLGRTKELFLRWTAVGALSSFMENSGDGEHFPWKFDKETTDIYRSWVNLRYTLVPYLYSEGTKVAIYRNGTLMQPCGDTEVLFSYAYFLPMLSKSGKNWRLIAIYRNDNRALNRRLIADFL